MEMAAKFSAELGLHAVVLFIFCIAPCIGIKKDPRSQFYGHAVVHPSIYTENRQKRDIHSIKVYNEEKLIVGFVAFDKNFEIVLEMNKLLLPSHYFEKYHENGSHVTHLPMKNDPSHCHYQGHILGVNESWAAISTCNGTLNGVFSDSYDLHYIHPDEKYDDGRHFIFRSSDSIPQNLTCGYSGSADFLATSQDLSKLKRNRRSTVLQEPYKSNAKSRYVELIIVNDNKEFKEFNGDKNAVFERSKMIANIVNGLYSPLNIYIALVGVIVWSETDEIKLSPDGDATMANFLHYRRERLAQEHPNDNAQLITAMTFDGGVVGKALKGPICTYHYSGGVNMDHSHVVGLVATTLSHELGHNFGMEHDSELCHCPDEKCIMAPSSSSTSPRHWSSCSLDYLKVAFSQGMDYCLKNRPTEIFGPVCGNKFLEEGEECDCGLKEFCDNHCCNATTCRLFENATCAMGACCDYDTCQVKKISTPCRPTMSECDFPEYCDGVSEFCPENTYYQNGEKCGNKQAYCYDGHCQSHGDQCKLLWGQTGKMSDLRCFEQNYKGNVNGNCGYNRVNQTYKSCRKDDVLCGMLHCTHLNEKLEFGMESAAILARSFINVRGQVYTCRSAIVDLGLFNVDPGLSPNGAKCGEDKACVNQKCVPISSLKKVVCPYGCSGNGICNNRGNCHCDNGYAPPYCDSPGAGGSIDSGPVSDPSKSFVVMAMYVVFLGLLPLIVLSALAIYYYRSHLKTWWSKRAHKANIKSRTKTTTQRKAQPPSKFNFDRNSLRTLEISAPIPNSSSFVSSNNPTSSLPKRSDTSTDNFCQMQISPPMPQNATNTANKFIPVRPAPPRPEHVPKRVPSWTPTTVSVTPTVIRTSSLRSSCEGNTGGRPLSASFRPSCPPPRPPPPKTNSPIIQQNLANATYEDVIRPTEIQRSDTPNSSYYDDCQTLDFSDTPLSFVHRSGQKITDENKNCEISTRRKAIKFPNASAIKEDEKSKTNKTVNNDQKVYKVLPRVPRTSENSIVASLTQRFEKHEDSKINSSNVSLMPPFKSRPLPPRPDNPNV